MKRRVSGKGLLQAVLTVSGVCAIAMGLREGGAQGRVHFGMAAVLLSIVALLQYRFSRQGSAPTTDRFGLPWWLGVAVPGAFFTWASFMYVGVRTRRPQWLYAGIGYLAAFFLSFVVAGEDGSLGGVILAGVWFFGLGHAAAINAQVETRLENRGEGS